MAARTGNYMKETALKALREFAEGGKVPPREAKMVAGELERLARERVGLKQPLEHLYEYERRVLIKEVLLNPRAKLSDYLCGERGRSDFYLSIPGVRATTLRNYDSLSSEMFAYVEKPYGEAIEIDRAIEPSVRADPISAMLLNGASDAIRRDALDRAKLEGVMTQYALEAFRLERGQYPASLDELKQARLIRALPLDPFDGRPLRYRRSNGGYELYSVGPDMKDDGGRFFPPANEGQWSDADDLVFHGGTMVTPESIPSLEQLKQLKQLERALRGR